jgi:drug/metabolite transporter (DMT)-like permease
VPHPDARPLRAIALMLGATASFVGMQAFVKLGRQAGMSTADVVFYRSALGIPVLFFILRRRGQSLAPDEPGDVLVRCVFGTIAMTTNFTSMRWLSLAQFSTLSLTQPVFVALASPFILSESVRKGTWLAIMLAVTGSLTLLWPGLVSDHVSLFPSFLALISASASAFAVMWVRKTTASEPAERVVFHFAIFTSLASLLFAATQGVPLTPPHGLSTSGYVTRILGMGTFGTLGQLLMTRAFSLGEAATVSMVNYAGIALSVLVDLFLFDVTPATTALAGAGLIVCAGVVLVRAARTQSKALVLPVPAP